MLELDNLSKVYGSTTALHPISLNLEEHKTHVFIGSSGSGKSTVLRLVAGFTQPTSGSIKFRNESLQYSNKLKLAQQIGYVIQEGGLFPHLSAKENVILPGRLQKFSKDKIQARLNSLMDLMQLTKKQLHRFPKELSGGQRQRLSLMRALFLDAPLLLLDEPLGALDPLVRSHLQIELKQIFNEVKKTVILITHDISEAAFFSHTVSLLDKSHLQQHGSFHELLHKPANEFVKSFVQEQKPDMSLWQ